METLKQTFAAMVTCLSALSVSAAVLTQEGFETSRDSFVADVPAEDYSAVTNYLDAADKPGDDAAAAYPFNASGYGSNYLAVDTGDTTIRHAFAPSSSRVYFDAMVKFTTTEGGDLEYEVGSKFTLYLDAATSNLCAVSGASAIDQTIVTNRLDSLQIEPGSWGRLTVNAVRSDGVFAFQVRVNGTLLTAGVVDTFYSMTTDTTMSEVNFTGCGALDNVAVRTTDPYIAAPAATIGGEGYASLEDALEEAQAGDTIVLAGTVNVNSTSVIDLKGTTITAAGLSAFTVGGGATLTVSNGTVNAATLASFDNGTLNVLTGTYSLTSSIAGAGTGTIAISGGKFNKAIDKSQCASGYAPRTIADGGYYTVVPLADNCAIYSTYGNSAYSPDAGNGNANWQAFTLSRAATASSMPTGSEGDCYLFNTAGDNIATSHDYVRIKSITVKWGNSTHANPAIGRTGSDPQPDAYIVVTDTNNVIFAISGMGAPGWTASGTSTFEFAGEGLASTNAYHACFMTDVSSLHIGDTLSSTAAARVNMRFHFSSGKSKADASTASYGEGAQQNTYSANMSIVVESAVASFDGVYYPTLSGALGEASYGDTVTLVGPTSESVTIPSGVTVAIVDGIAFDGTVSGAGTVKYTAAQSGTIHFANDWTGTVTLDYAISGSPWLPSTYGVTGSWVEIGENGSFSGYLNASVNPGLKVSGTLSLTDGSSDTEYVIPKLSGTGTMSITQSRKYTISELVDWDGELTIIGTLPKIVNITSGSGTVTLNSQLTTAPTSIGSGFDGNIVLSYSGATGYISGYCGANSTLTLKDFTGYIKDADGNGTGVIPGTVVITNSATINDAWYLSSGNTDWTAAKVIQFADLRLDGSFKLEKNTGRAWSGVFAYCSASNVSVGSEGSIEVGSQFRLRVCAFDFASAPSGSSCVVPLTLTANGQKTDVPGTFYGPNGVQDEYIPVTVNGVPTGKMLYRGANGLHLCAASVMTGAIGSEVTNYYPTVLAAIQAASATGADVTVLDGSDSSAGNFGEYGYCYDNGTWKSGAATTTHEIDPSSVTTNAYLTLADAIANSAAGDTVALLKANAEIEVGTTGKDFVFNLNGKEFTGTLAGSGTCAFNSVLPPANVFTNEAWVGTVKILSVSTGLNGFDLSQYGNANSTIELTGVGSADGTSVHFVKNFTYHGRLVLTDDGDTKALTLNNGYSDGCVSIGELCGGGTLKMSNNTQGYITQGIVINVMTNFSGKIEPSHMPVTFGTSRAHYNSTNMDKLFIDSDAVLSVQAGFTLWSPAAFAFNGPVNFTTDAASYNNLTLFTNVGNNVTFGANSEIKVNGVTVASGLEQNKQRYIRKIVDNGAGGKNLILKKRKNVIISFGGAGGQ